MVAEFQHGLVRLDVVIAALALIASGLGLAAIWVRLGAPVGRRIARVRLRRHDDRRSRSRGGIGNGQLGSFREPSQLVFGG